MDKRYLPTRPSKYLTILLIIIIILFFLLENPFVVSKLGGNIFNYIIKPIIWAVLAFYMCKKPSVRPGGKHKLKSFINLWAFNFGVIYILISIIAGLFDGFGKSPYSSSLKGIAINLITIGSMVIAKEMIRASTISSFTKKENYLLFVLISIVFAATNISIGQYFQIKDYKDLVQFTANYFAPEFCNSMLATYLVYLGGPFCSIIYLGIIQSFHWFSPVLPNLTWLTQALVGILCPVFSLTLIQNIYMSESKEIKKRDIKEEGIFGWMITCIFSIGIIWFSVGVFPIYPSVIATGSMEPLIKPGDVIIVKKVDADEIKVGDIVQFQSENILISHRVIDVMMNEEKKKSFKTKGDNNSIPDNSLVSSEFVKGKIVYVVPKIGWPALILKQKDDVSIQAVEF